jgi:hypothetical protein
MFKIIAVALLSTLQTQANFLPDDVDEGLARLLIAELSIAQLQKEDPRWHPEQRDCAGLVRFVYRRAFTLLGSPRAVNGFWRDASGQNRHFADAENLLRYSFRRLGKTRNVAQDLRSGDLLAFRQAGSHDSESNFHLMLVVRPSGSPLDAALVVYHTGSLEHGMRSGTLAELYAKAPAEWQPTARNHAFLGFFRLKEWQQ